MDRNPGARVASLFQLLEKVGGKNAKKLSPEDLHQLRYLSTKLLQVLVSQDKLQRDMVIKQPANVELLLTTLETTNDKQIIENIVSLLAEMVCRTTTGKRATILVNHGTTNIILRLLVAESKETSSSEQLLHSLHQVLGKIGHKDRKFGIKARLNQALLVTLGLIKNNSSNFHLLHPMLHVFKLYTANSVNASYLGKHNAIPHIFKVMALCGRKHIPSLRLCLDIINNLSKSKSNSARCIGMGGVHTLLCIYYDWHQADNKHRHISIRKVILYILKNITNLRSGRSAFLEADGIRILYETSQDVIDCREMESLILTASIIMRKCCPRNKLPIANLLSAVSCTLPQSEYYVPYGMSQDFRDCMAAQNTDSDHSSVDEDDDIDSDDERFKVDNSEAEEEQDDEIETLYSRTPEELQMYEQFFPELFEFEQYVDVPPEVNHVSRPETRSARAQSVHSNLELLSNLLDNEAEDYSLNSSKRMPASVSDSGLYTPKGRNRKQEVQRLSELNYGDNIPGPSGASAVNLKTGASVFSLDLHLPHSSKSIQKTTQSATKVKKGKATKKSTTLPSKEKKTKKGKSEPVLNYDLRDSLSITPLPTPREAADDFGKSSFSSDEDDNACFVYDSALYTSMAADTRSVYRFTKLAYPDLHGSRPPPYSEALYHRKFGIQRAKVFEDIDRLIHSESIIDRVVYDLDDIVTKTGDSYTDPCKLGNNDEQRIGRPQPGPPGLRFNAEFECGNLRKAIQIREYEYDLILNPDIGSNHHHQWFYFEVSNVMADISYRFNIVNCEKTGSQVNFGMKPLMFSVREAMEGRPYWVRTGKNICYYRNHFSRSPQATGGVKGKTYYTTTFSITFQHHRDVCYLAYHYPYTYTTLKSHLYLWERNYDSSQVYMSNQVLGESISGNSLPVLTITAAPKSLDMEGVSEFVNKPYIFLSARVHPGESNSSWVMRGVIDFLLGSKIQAQMLREAFIFKIVPMLNPDGVLNGNHRCSLVADDLNRKWLFPCPNLHPTIFHTKGLMQYMKLINRSPMVFCDFHGHSKKKNIFMFGCNPLLSWINNDVYNPVSTGNRAEDNCFKTLPKILQQVAPAFSLQNCNFSVEKAKESTARVVVWRQIQVARSYTMESSYCGCDQGKYKDFHISTKILEEMGVKFCESLLKLLRNRMVFESSSNISQYQVAQHKQSYSTSHTRLLEEEYDSVKESDDLLKESNSDSDVSDLLNISDSDDEQPGEYEY